MNDTTTYKVAAPTEQIIPCHECGAPMTRDVRPRTFTYEAESETVDMPGWYWDDCGESIHSGVDMAVSGQAIRRLKAFDGNATEEN